MERDNWINSILFRSGGSQFFGGYKPKRIYLIVVLYTLEYAKTEASFIGSKKNYIVVNTACTQLLKGKRRWLLQSLIPKIFTYENSVVYIMSCFVFLHSWPVHKLNLSHANQFIIETNRVVSLTSSSGTVVEEITPGNTEMQLKNSAIIRQSQHGFTQRKVLP